MALQELDYQLQCFFDTKNKIKEDEEKLKEKEKRHDDLKQEKEFQKDQEIKFIKVIDLYQYPEENGATKEEKKSIRI